MLQERQFYNHHHISPHCSLLQVIFHRLLFSGNQQVPSCLFPLCRLTLARGQSCPCRNALGRRSYTLLPDGTRPGHNKIS